jgi:ubiquinone/menaquinone biosynthesis C-methylase UbiE
MAKKRTKLKKIADFISFPFRAFTLIEEDKWALSCLASERFYYVAEEVKGRCLDVGCGKHNRFINEFIEGHGVGIDVYKYEGLTDDNIVEDMKSFPFEDISFKTITFIANINHIPKKLRDDELKEAFRCLEKDGNIIITMGNPLVEIIIHKVVWFYDKFFKTNLDMDNERGMHEDEEYYLLDKEIIERLKKAGFSKIQKRYFTTQWFLNHMFIAWK